MEVRIGVVYTPREIVLEMADDADVGKAIEAGLHGEQPLLWLTDAKGRRVGIPTDKLAYVEIGHGTLGQVGFRS
jgi:hypothetical protein